MLTLVEAADPVVTYSEAKEHLRLDHDAEQAYVEALVATATMTVQERIGRALGEQVWDLKLDGRWWLHGRHPINQPHWAWNTGLGWAIRLPFPPLVSVDSVTYLDTDGAEQTYAPSNYVVTGAGGSGLITLASSASWPAVASHPEAMTIRFTVGEATVPAPVKHAILLLVAHLYENRSEVVSTAQKPERLPMGVDALVAPYRVFA